MGEKFKLDDVEYEIDDLSSEGKMNLASLQFVSMREKELNNMKALLQRAKNSYVGSLKKEMLSNKAGLFLDDD